MNRVINEALDIISVWIIMTISIKSIQKHEITIQTSKYLFVVCEVETQPKASLVLYRTN